MMSLLRHEALCHSLFLQKSTQDISLLRIFQLNHIVLHFHQSVQCVRACVHACVRVCGCVRACIFCIIMLEHLSIYIYIVVFLDNVFHLEVHYVCMLVQRFEPQSRRFTNFHYYYYTLRSTHTHTHTPHTHTPHTHACTRMSIGQHEEVSFQT